MRRFSLIGVLIFAVGAAVPGMWWAPATASPRQQYDGPYFGQNNFPPGCTRDMSPANPENVCFHMKTGLNSLDSPQVDVLIMVPASATAERDMRIMRQSVEMWENGIDYLADQMGLDWLEEGVDFHVAVDYFDPNGNGGEFTTYPIVDPEIVVIAANPTGGAGIGIEPVDFLGESGFDFIDENGVPCHNVANPFDFEYWDSLPGFDSHHGQRAGTYTEDCNGAGGNICFAVNGAVDPDPTAIDAFGLFDLVSHEVGHCLTLGHVGDGGETIVGQGWGPVPANDIMSYSKEPVALTKCVSTLDVESFALRMSRYLDVDGNGVIGPEDALSANDTIGAGGLPFQVQNPADHLYASSTGSPFDCPQPDLGLVPGARTDWTPDPVASVEPVLDVTAPADGAAIADETITVTGAVRERSLFEPPTPTSTTGAFDDADDDATTPTTEITALEVSANETHVEAVIQLSRMWPSSQVTSPVSYSLIVDGKQLDSLVRYPGLDVNPVTWDGSGYLPDRTSEWDTANNRVLFHVSREYLSLAGISAPYQVSATANLGTLVAVNRDDWAPEQGQSVGIAAPVQQRTPPADNPSDDDDGDGVPDSADACPRNPGLGADGCAPQDATRVEVYVDGVLAGSQDVYADYEPDDFAIPVALSEGAHAIRVRWVDGQTELAGRDLEVTRT